MVVRNESAVSGLRFSSFVHLVICFLSAQLVAGQQVLPLHASPAFETGKTRGESTAVMASFTKANDLFRAASSNILAKLPGGDWESAGDAGSDPQRLVGNNRVPFEMRTVKAMSDGFEVELIKPANTRRCLVKGVKVSADGMKAGIVVAGVSENYIQTLRLDEIRDVKNFCSLAHPAASTTLNTIPEDAKLSPSETSTKRTSIVEATKAGGSKEKAAMDNANADTGAPDNSKKGKLKTAHVKNVPVTKAVAKPTFASVKPLLIKNTCAACHNEIKRQVGPAFADVAKRKYSVSQIIKLVRNPRKENWPDYETQMPPLPQVPQADLQKIALWIKSLEN